jgi:hypothetical protein
MDGGMARIWHIEGYDGGALTFECSMPGNMSNREIEIVLQRLAARHLSENEVVSASLRRNAKNRSPLLDRIGNGFPIMYGENPYYIATPKDA